MNLSPGSSLFKEKTVFIASAIIWGITALFSSGFYHFDEHFQILEFAGIKLGINTPDDLPWEYHEQMRPSLQPVMVVGFAKVLSSLNLYNPFLLSTLLRLVSAALGWFAMYRIYQLYKGKFESSLLQKWFLLFSFLAWLILFNGVRFSSENWSGIFLLLGFTILISNSSRISMALLTGICLGLAATLRFQVGIAVITLFLWAIIIERQKFSTLLFTAFGALLPVGLLVLSDRWFYGLWTLTPWNYFAQNMLEDKVSNFGVSPWWKYFELFLTEGIPPFSIVLITAVASMLIIKPKSPITWCVIPFVLIHFLIGHKELRFLYPMLGFLPVIFFTFLNWLATKTNPNWLQTRPSRIFFTLFVAAYSIMLLVTMFKPAELRVPLYKKIYNTTNRESIPVIALKPDIYERVGLQANFYKPDGLDYRVVEDISEISGESNIIFVCLFRDLPERFQENEDSLIYTSFPRWLTKVNVNDWLSRTKLWCAYHL